MASAALVQCTFHGNTAPWGSNISCDCSSNIEMSNCIVTGGVAAEGFYVDDYSSATLVCTDIYGNAGGDWIGPLAGQFGQDGNITADPLYCNALARDFTLAESSPCAPEGDPECGLIGAHPVGCAMPTGTPLESVPANRVILEPGFPNPFNPSTTLCFVLPEDARARLGVYTLEGRLVRRLVDDPLAAGLHEVAWDGVDRDGRSVPSGIYLGVLEVAGTRQSQRLVLLK
jgi:hypothetical protein